MRVPLIPLISFLGIPERELKELLGTEQKMHSISANPGKGVESGEAAARILIYVILRIPERELKDNRTTESHSQADRESRKGS